MTASAVPDARMVLIARGTLAAVAVVQVAWLTFVGYVLLMLLR